MDRITVSAAAEAAVSESQERALQTLLGYSQKPTNVIELEPRRYVRGPTAPNFNRRPNEREQAFLAAHFQSFADAIESLPRMVAAIGAAPPRRMQDRLDFIRDELAEMAAELAPMPVDAA
jgi:hypothetical protein